MEMPVFETGSRSLSRQAIESLIPHRAPFLFLDEVQILAASKLAGHMTWSDDHPILQGHFPSMPIVPGVCQLEAMAQLVGVGIADSSKNSSDNTTFIGVLGAVRNSSFHRPVLPKQKFEMIAETRALSPQSFIVKGTGHIAGQLACRAELIILLTAMPAGVAQ